MKNTVKSTTNDALLINPIDELDYSFRARLIRNDFYKNILTSNKQKPLTIQDFQISLMLLLQMPFTLVIYENDFSNLISKKHYITNTDPSQYDRIEKYLNEILLSKGRSYFEKNCYDLFPANYRNKNYKILILSVINSLELRYNVSYKIFERLEAPIKTTEQKSLEAFLELKNSKASEEYYSFYIKTISHTINKWTKKYSHNTLLNLPIKDDVDYKLVSENRNIWLSNIEEIINEIYERNSLLVNNVTLLLTKKKPHIPNLLIAARYYSRNRLRNNRQDDKKSLNYDLSFLMPDYLSNSIKKFFRLKNKDSFSNIRMYFSKNFEQYQNSPDTISENEKNLVEKIDAKFWHMVDTNKIEDIIKIFCEIVSDNFKSFTDSVFITGVSQIKYPFENSGLQRIFETKDLVDEFEKIAKDTNKFNDLLRIVIAYYILLLMCPEIQKEKKATSFAVYLYPIMVGGVVWGVGACALPKDFVSSYASEIIKENPNNKNNNNMIWAAGYHLLASVKPSIVSDIHYKLRDLHFFYFNSIISDVTNKHFIERSFNLDSFTAELNKKLQVFSTCSPFPLAKFSFIVIESPQRLSDKSVNVYYKKFLRYKNLIIYLKAEFSENPYFPREQDFFIGDNFSRTTIDSLAEKIYRAIDFKKNTAKNKETN